MNVTEFLAALPWGPPKTVQTRVGERVLRTCAPTEDFWSAWRGSKNELKRAGLSVGKGRDGSWEVCWWAQVSAEVRRVQQAAVIESRAADSDLAVPAPAGLSYLPYQRAGIAYALARQNTLIADEMGLGKTIQAIGVINADESLRRVLIICPASLRLNWQRECERWLVMPRRIEIANGKAYPHNAEIVIINYDILGKHEEALASPWDLIIADEAHYLKNRKAQRTRAALAIPSTRYLFLTGTPITNRPIELFPLLTKLDPQGLGANWYQFAKRYCGAHQTRFGFDTRGATNLDELQTRLRSTCMVRRRKADVLTELPAKRRQVIELAANGSAALVEGEIQAARLHDEEIAALRLRVELAKTSDNEDEYRAAVNALKEGISAQFSEMSKLRHDLAVAKVPSIIEHLESAIDQGLVVCFAHHKDVLSALKEAFPGAVMLVGDTPMDERQAAVDAFQNGQSKLFLGSIGAAGVGITLTAAAHVVFAELDWVPANMSQAEDRCHRIGQRSSVLVQHLVFENSLDANMARKLIEKQAVIDAALDAALDNEVQAVITTAAEEIGSAELTFAQVAKESADISDEHIALVHRGLKRLDGVCDGAYTRDNVGFAACDSWLGKRLAAQAELSPKQAVLGRKLLRRYRKTQLSADFAALWNNEKGERK